MKLTRHILRKLIIEALINEADTKRYISSPDGDVTPADLAVLTAQGKDMVAADVHPSIATLVQSDDIESRAQGRVLADTLEDIPEITPGEATAIDILGYEKSFEEDEGLKPAIDKAALYGAMKSKSKSILERFGFQYIEDMSWLFSDSGKEDYQDVHDMLRFQAQALGCGDIKNLAFVDSETSESRQVREAIYDMLRAINPSQKPQPIPIPGYPFENVELHALGDLRVLFTSHMGGYYTTTICGK
jgi:hypothetical protein